MANDMSCANSEGPDQPAHPRRLISTFSGRQCIIQHSLKVNVQIRLSESAQSDQGLRHPLTESWGTVEYTCIDVQQRNFPIVLFPS